MKVFGDTDRNARIIGGFRRLIDWLAAGSPVIYNASASAFVWNDDRVIVVCGDGTRVIAEMAVVTTPIDVLSNLVSSFNPALPPELSAAIRRLRMGPAAKVLVHVKRIEWPNFSAFASNGVIQVWWNHEHNNQHTLVGFSAGPGTKRVAAFTSREIVEQAIEDIAAIGGVLRGADIVDVERRVWNARGKMAYSYIPVGAVGSREILARSVFSKLWFAGEAAVPPGLAGTVSGAVESAINVSNEIVAIVKHDAECFAKFTC